MSSPSVHGPDAPRASVLLPVRDAEATLAACLTSVSRQGERRFECVIVDDGSTDGSLAIARRFAGEDARFRVIAREHEGLVATLNAGLERCRADVIVRMDADDVMRGPRVAAQCDALDADASLSAVGAHVRLFPRGTLKDGWRAYERWLNSIDSPALVERDRFVECPVAHPTLAVRREVLLEARYRDRGWPEDYDLVLRMLAAGQRIGVVPRRLLAWRRGEGRLSATDPAYAVDRFVACKAHFLARGFLSETDRYVLWGHGPTGRALSRALREHGKRPALIVEVHPRRIGQRIDGVRVIGVGDLRRPDLPLVAAVAGEEARGLIRGRLAELGLREGRDFVCAA